MSDEASAADPSAAPTADASPDPGVASAVDLGLCRAFSDGALVSSAYESGLRRISDALFDLLRHGGFCLRSDPDGETRPASAEEHAAILSSGDLIGRKLTRLLQGVAELRGQSVELAAIANLLVRLANQETVAPDVCAELVAVFDGFRQPYTVIGADGIRRGVLDGDPRLGTLSERSLAVDGTREVVWCHGRELSMRRRSLLWRFFLLLAEAPGVTFSKEVLVRTIWGAEYHSLRRDPALFTTVLRIRKMLGEDGGRILQSVGGGYQLVVPLDFLCVVRTERPTPSAADLAFVTSR